jgi:hypothetical protein
MKIKGLEGYTGADVENELARGAKFVMYQYCISVVFMTFKRPSSIYFIPSHKGPLLNGLLFTTLSTLLGWWGIPWGPIYTIESMWVNSTGGRDVTREVMASVSLPVAASMSPAR